jgi:large subunit ribosomal protein L23
MQEHILISPRLSEKAYGLSMLGVYVFNVPLETTKAELTKAIESQYSVRVKNINLLVSKGKKARSIRLKSRSKPVVGKRPNTKKAYITLKKGDTIKIEAFQEVKE